MKNILLLLTGILLGIILTIFVQYQSQSDQYATLNKDYQFWNGGILKKGTKIKYYRSFPEGFEQYILYVNVTAGNAFKLETEEHKSTVIPHWIEKRK